jgi:Asp/Glu/hydantoin racemase
MNTSVTLNQNLVLLARVFERLERSVEAVDADQYRSVVSHLSSELEAAPHDAGLDALLVACPAVAELYENMNYRHAGLCRSALDSAMSAELKARAAIAAARSH